MTRSVLLDTNVVSELARPRPDARVVKFVRGLAEPFISALTLHELAFGAERIASTKQKAKLLAWVASIDAEFGGRIVVVDSQVAQQAGRLRGLAAASGRTVSAVDALIAASALAVGAAVATRNVRDFEPLGVPLVDPWAGS